MKPRELRTLLTKYLGYSVVNVGKTKGGSHRTLRSTVPGRGQVVLAFHDGVTIGPGLVWSIFVKQVGLTNREALEVLKRA